MLSKALCFAISGLDAYPIAIEADISPGLPAFHVVGLPDSAVRESRERVRAALKNSGYAFPAGRITVNLSPADTKKEGPAFDVAIALSILTACGHVSQRHLASYAFLGELSLDGSILPVNGALAFALAADPLVCRGLLVPAANAAEAALAGQVPVFPAKHLKEIIHFLGDPSCIPAAKPGSLALQSAPFALDFSDVKGNAQIKRGLEIAAAGGHNALLIGPPGSGKTMLAKRVPGILPDLSLPEALEVTKIHSVAGLLPAAKGIVTARPFRSPHHTSSDIALIGGGPNPKPGEVSLAHNGVLFLDELPEFNRHVLEVLRQPLEDHYVTIARAKATLKFPCKFMLVAAMNPCPCGWRMGGKKACSCTGLQVDRYVNKISGPLLDRIDIHLQVPALKPADIFDPSQAETSAAIKKRTTVGRTIQMRRLKSDNLVCNSQMPSRLLRKHCGIDEDGKRLLKQAMETLGLSGRGHDKILRVARTIADLDGCPSITPAHLAEAIGYRVLDRRA